MPTDLPPPPPVPPESTPIPSEEPDDVRRLREEHRIMLGLLRELVESSLVSYLREVGRSTVHIPGIGKVRVQVIAALAALFLGFIYLLPADIRAPVVERAVDWIAPPPLPPGGGGGGGGTAPSPTL